MADVYDLSEYSEGREMVEQKYVELNLAEVFLLYPAANVPHP